MRRVHWTAPLHCLMVAAPEGYRVGVWFRSLRDVHVYDLAVLFDCPVHIAPEPGDLDIGFVREPAVTHRMATWPSGVDDERRELLNPCEPCRSRSCVPRQ